MTNRFTGDVDLVLRPGVKLNLLFDVDLINDFTDARSAMVLAMTERSIIIGQTSTPIARSMAGSVLGASFVCRNPANGALLRLGWHCQIQKVISGHRLRPTDTQPTEVVAVSRPAPGGLVETNSRMDYRLRITRDQNISIQTHPSFGLVHLMDFSAGGLLIGIPRPPQAEVGRRLWFTLFFPPQAPIGHINGEAEVLRVTVEEGEQFARLALKFIDMDLNTTRALQKLINFYLQEEQQRPAAHIAALLSPKAPAA